MSLRRFGPRLARPWGLVLVGWYMLAAGPRVVRAQADASGQVTAFVDVDVVPLDHEQVLPHQTVVVRHGRIAALGLARSVRIPTGARRIDGRGKYLIPGLADMHYHIGIADSVNAERQLFLLLANGVTTIRNLDYMPNNGQWLARMDSEALLRLRARAAAGDLLSPRIYTSGQWRTHPEQSLEQNLLAYKAAGYDFVKIHDESGATVDTMIPIAHRLGLRLLGHADNDSVSLTRALAAPFASIEHFRGYGEDTTVIPALVAATKRAGVWNCPTEVMYEDTGNGVWSSLRTVGRTYIPAGGWMPPRSGDRPGRVRPTDPVVVFRRQLIKALQDAGAGLLLGTDGLGAGPPGYMVHLELELLVRAGLTPYQALLTGTRNVAEFFGTLDSTGTVAVGKRADLVLLYGNPLVNIRHTATPAGVMLDGRWLSRDELDRRLASYVTQP